MLHVLHGLTHINVNFPSVTRNIRAFIIFSERSYQSPERRVSGTDISDSARSPANTLDRRRRDEENARHRDYMVRVHVCFGFFLGAGGS